MYAQKKSTYRLFIKIALPSVLVSIMSPLIEIIDLMVIGNSGHVACMAGIGIAIGILNIITWLFGINILSFSSQVVKMNDRKSRIQVLYNAILFASSIGILFILMKTFIWNSIVNFYDVTSIVKVRGAIYYNIVSWSMPFILINHAIIGWLISTGHIKGVLVLQLSMNVVNLILNIVFVRGLNVDLEAVALSTVLINVIVAVGSIGFVFKYSKVSQTPLMNTKPLGLIKFFYKNKDRMIQSLCAIFINIAVGVKSSQLGLSVLATNMVLLQLQSLFSYLFGGFSTIVAELTNLGYITHNIEFVRRIEETCMAIIMYTVVFFILLYRIFHNVIIHWFTNILEVQKTINLYDGWLMVYLIMASWGLGLQGIFRGREKDNLVTWINLVGLIIFITILDFLMRALGNHGIWLAVIIFHFIRSTSLMALGG